MLLFCSLYQTDILLCIVNLFVPVVDSHQSLSLDRRRLPLLKIQEVPDVVFNFTGHITDRVSGVNILVVVRPVLGPPHSSKGSS